MEWMSNYIAEFVAITGHEPRLDDAYRAELDRLVARLDHSSVLPLPVRRRRFLGRMNWKFRLNAEPLARFYARAAKAGVTFHFHQKRAIQRAFDERDADQLAAALADRGCGRGLAAELVTLFDPVPESATIAHLKDEIENPSKLRREVGDRDIAGEIAKAQFSAFMWESLPEREMHAFFDRDFRDDTYRESFWEELHQRAPDLFSRNRSLDVIRVGQRLVDDAGSLGKLRDQLCGVLRDQYDQIDNYGFLAVLLDPLVADRRDVQWELAADLALYAEKHREVELKHSYFRPGKIAEATMAHIPGIDPTQARFDLANEGYTYKDCFVLADLPFPGEMSLLLLFQKNQRDETVVPCPACRSSRVAANSYPSLGVRSWECENPLCPDRSKYNRGKRYNFKGLVMQRALEDEDNEITADLVKDWDLDVVRNVALDDVLDMLVRFYSLAGDRVHLFDWPEAPADYAKRTIVAHRLADEWSSETTDGFWSSALFARYVAPPREPSYDRVPNLGSDDFQVLNGDAAEALGLFPEATFDGAVTSPPYYNAREYSQWANMYCYLYDMLNVAREVYRTLKPGALFYYNIFDYFDNENTVVFSAMGDKRVILSAYTVDLFRRVGFVCEGNVVWDKGQIEGKRGFNGGNFSPYYQAPFNCWEHVLVFRKPGPAMRCEEPISRILVQQPVIKMVRGTNTYGHTAPFPESLPRLLIDQLPAGSFVLDPFGGSMTTGRVASRLGHRSVCVELSEEYCRLGLKMKADEDAFPAAEQMGLFVG
jgi:DNA modification methylase